MIRRERREFLRMAGVFLVTASCDPEKLFGPDCEPKPPIPDPEMPRRDVSITGGNLDTTLASLDQEESLALHLSGRFATKGCYRWGQYASRNVGGNWTIDGDAQVSLEPQVMDSQPLYVFASKRARRGSVASRS